MPTTLLRKSARKTALQSRLQSMTRTYITALEDLAPLNLNTLDVLVNTLRQISGKLLFSGVGKSGHIATKLAASFSSIGLPAVFIHPTDAAHGDLGLVNPQDMLFVLSNSGHTEELTPLIQHALRLETPVVAMTSNAQSPLAAKATHVLTLPQASEICPLGMAPTTSTLLMLALGDMLLSLVAEAKNLTSAVYKQLHPSGSLGFQLLTLKDVMHKGDALPLVLPTTPMKEALLEMTHKRFGSLFVVDTDNRLLGIVTDGDLRRCLNAELLNTQVENIMTRDPLCCHADLSLASALHLMQQKAVNVLAIVDDQRHLEGIVHWQDCIRAAPQNKVPFLNPS
ncbi:MAG: KpsF/GutQ family sugar-phosphate isomerase [Holosporaceae bacterium]